MAEYRFIARRFIDGLPLAALPLAGVTYGYGLNDHLGGFRAQLKFPVVTAGGEWRALAATWKDAIQASVRTIDVVRDGVTMNQYEIIRTSYDAGTQTATIEGREVIGWFSDVTINHASVQQKWAMTARPITVAQQLFLNHDEPGFSVTFPKGNPSLPATYHYWLGSDFKPVLEAVSELAKDGFDYSQRISDVPGASSVTRTIELWKPSKGYDRSAAVKLSKGLGAANVLSLNTDQPGVKSKAFVTSTFGTDGNKILGSATYAPVQPNRVIVRQLFDQANPNTMNSQASALLTSWINPEIITVRAIADGADLQLGAFETGDVLTIHIAPDNDPYYPEGLHVKRRIVTYDVAVSDGPEEISFMLDNPATES